MFLNINEHKKDKIAAKDSRGEEITYGGLSDFSLKFKDLVPSRSLVFILSQNTVGALNAYYACLENKVVPLILGADLKNSLVMELFDTYLPNYAWLPLDSTAFSEMPHKEVLESRGYRLVRFDNPKPKLYSDLSLLLSTSGSTGSPKLVRHSYGNVSENAKNIASFFQMSPNDKALATLPLQYTMGLSVVTSYLYAGATVLLSDLSLLDKEFWNFVKENRATSFSGVPFSYEVLRKIGFFKMDLPDLVLLNQGGGKLSTKLFEAFANYAQENNKKFIATYGQTEGTARMSYLPAAWATTKTGSIGIPIPGGSMHLIDADANVIEGIEKEGELVYRGPNVTLGYAVSLSDLEKGDENKQILNTGDYAYMDKDGCYFILGRKKRFLKLMGVRVSLDQVENLIKNELQIDSVASGDDKKLLIYITEESKKKEVLSLVTDRFNIFHRAVEVQVIEEIKRNHSGKIIIS